MRILVTGGTGFIGFHLSRKLLQLGHTVEIVDNLSRNADSVRVRTLKELGSRIHVGDLSREFPREIEPHFDLVYHLAAINGTRYFYEMPSDVLRVNLLALLNVLEWLKQNSSKRIVFASSSEVYAGTIRLLGKPIPTGESVPMVVDDIQNPRLSYAVSKIAGESLCLSYQVQHHFDPVIVRLHNIYGPGMGNEHVIPQFIQRAMEKQNPFKIYGAGNTRAFCYVDDAVGALVLLADRQVGDFRILHLGNDKEEIKMSDLALRIIHRFHYAPRIENLQAPRGSVERRVPDISLARRLLGYEAKIGLDEGISRLIESMRGEN